jgi:guanylate kinase
MKQALKEMESIILAERIRTKRLDIAWLEENFIREKDDKLADHQAPSSGKQGGRKR